MAYNNSKDYGFWDLPENIILEMKNFTDDEFIKTYKEDKLYQKNIIKVIVKCKKGTIRDVGWNTYKGKNSKCTCVSCKKDRKEEKKLKNFLNYKTYFSKFGLLISNSPNSVDESIYCKTTEGYYVLASISNLKRSERNNNLNFDKFGIRNKYQFENIKLFCKLKRPDYQIVGEYLNNKSVKEEIYFKYIGNNLKPNICRYFKTTIDLFINGGVSHPYLTISKGEMRIKDYLIKQNIKYKQQYVDNRCKDKKSLRFDFSIYTIESELLGLIEFDGLQHEKDLKWFGKSCFAEIQRRDEIKNKFCKDNNIPLLRIKQSKVNTTEKQLKLFIDECKSKKKESQYR